MMIITTTDGLCWLLMQTIISQQNFINWSTVLYTLLVMVSLAAAGSCVAFVDMLGCFTAGSYYSERFFLLREILHLCEAIFLGEENHAPKCSEGIRIVSPFRKSWLQILWCSNTLSSVRFKATIFLMLLTSGEFCALKQ